MYTEGVKCYDDVMYSGVVYSGVMYSGAVFYPSGMLLPKVFKDFYQDPYTNRLIPTYYTNEELHDYLRRHYGDRWYTSAWATVWLGKETYRPVRYRKRKIPKHDVHIPDDIIDSLINVYVQKGLHTNQIVSLLKRKHRIKVGYLKLRRRVKAFQDIHRLKGEYEA